MERVSKRNYYLDIAETVLERATCLRRVYGAIIVKNDEIISTGRYELCRSIHAEANAIISAARRDTVGSTLYLVGHDARTGELLSDSTSCPMCRRMIINAGINEVVIRRTQEDYDIISVQKWVDEDDSLKHLPVLLSVCDDAGNLTGQKPAKSISGVCRNGFAGFHAANG